MDQRVFSAVDLERVTERLLVAAGVPEDLAATVADELVGSNLAGHDSHGVIRVPEYLRAIAAGQIRPAARPRVVLDRQAVALVSGDWGFGQVSGRFAIDQAIERARGHGIAAVGLLRCNHLGRLGSFMERAAAAGCVAMMWVGGIGGTHQAVPFGGARSVFGANPLAAAFPAGEADPVILDFATTAVAGGKVMVAHDAGQQLPMGTIVDRFGEPTTDPAGLIDGGALLPFGGHKGYALAVLVELLGQALTGADTTGDDGAGGEPFARSGALCVAIDTGAFRPAAEVTASAARTVERIRAVPPAPGFERVQTPGEPEARSRQQRLADGISLPPKTWEAIVAAAATVGVARPDLPAGAVLASP